MEGRESIFQTVVNAELKPAVFNRDAALVALGYQRHIPEDARGPLETTFTDFFNRTVIRVEDWNRLAGGDKEDLSRKAIQSPPFSLLEKDGNYFYEIKVGPNLTFITEANPKTVLFRYFESFEGLPIKHVLVSGNDETTLDLSSVIIGEKAENLLSFSGRNPGRVPPRTYKPREDRVLEYGANIFFPIPVRSEVTNPVSQWDPESAIYLYLHENAHQALLAAGKGNDSMAKDERDANALALDVTRSMQKAFPKAMYLDPAVHRSWIETQLAEGYDKRLTEEQIKKQNFLIDDIATNKLRAVVRGKLSKEKKP